MNHRLAAPEFDQWLDGERQRLVDAFRRAAWALARRGARRRPEGAVAIARRRSPRRADDEVVLAGCFSCLRESGDHAAALRAYEDFAARLSRDYEAERPPRPRLSRGCFASPRAITI
jgi:serine/threonine-protein kinase